MVKRQLAAGLKRFQQRQLSCKTREAIPLVFGPIMGIPIEDMEAWEDALNDGIELPLPKPRCVE